MNIIHITESYGGGVKTHLDYLSKFFNETIEVFVFSKSFQTSEYNNVNFLKGDRTDIISLFRSLLVLHEKLNQENKTIIHAHSTIAGILGIVLKIMNRKRKIIFTPHAYYSQKPELDRVKKKIIVNIEKIIVHYSDKVIHVSKEEERHAINSGVISIERISKGDSKVIYNGVEKPKSIEDRRNTPDKIVIGNLARFNHQKNPLMFINIAIELIKQLELKNQKVSFLWAGDGPLMEGIKQNIEEKNLVSYFEFPGLLSSENIRTDFFEKIDYFMSSSLYEGLPYSVVEALSYSKPLILSKVVGHTELIKNNGLLFDLDRTEKLIAEDIAELIMSNYNYQLNKASNVLFFDKFEVENSIQQLRNVYVDFLGEMKR